jgi:excisionase family DNA binding protein
MTVNAVSGSSGAQSAHVVERWDNQPLLTLKQAAVYAICTPRYLQNQIRAGRLKALKPTGKLLRIRRSDLDAFFEAGATIGGGNW